MPGTLIAEYLDGRFGLGERGDQVGLQRLSC